MTEIKTVLITGASSGIGKALAFEFAARGKNLVLLARRADLLSQIKTAIIEKFPVAVHIITVDVTSIDALQHAITAVTAESGNIDTVIANAGFGVLGHVADLTTADFKRQFDVNVFGVLNTFYATLANLRATKGRLCLIGSTQSYLTTPNATAYCMSKYALRSLAEGLYSELSAEGIAVTLINPGLIKTDIRRTNNFGVFHEHNKDNAPDFLMMNVEVAARKIANAIQARKRERAVTFHSQLGIWVARFLPGLLAFVFRERRKNC